MSGEANRRGSGSEEVVGGVTGALGELGVRENMGQGMTHSQCLKKRVRHVGFAPYASFRAISEDVIYARKGVCIHHGIIIELLVVSHPTGQCIRRLPGGAECTWTAVRTGGDGFRSINQLNFSSNRHGEVIDMGNRFRNCMCSEVFNTFTDGSNHIGVRDIWGDRGRREFWANRGADVLELLMGKTDFGPKTEHFQRRSSTWFLGSLRARTAKLTGSFNVVLCQLFVTISHRKGKLVGSAGGTTFNKERSALEAAFILTEEAAFTPCERW
ncbi:hypothetical protein EV359DRAFT_68590 [Lentinula novae-zelandiae]|nr:hypothetical protein EV359DRAFT_68590 [Lentinula novae-zelandiae]